MIPKVYQKNHTFFLTIIALASWVVPGGGYFLLNEKKRAAVVCVSILAIFFIGVYVGSIGVVDPISSWPWYMGQVLNSPAVFILGRVAASGRYPVYGNPREIGLIYTTISGLLNLLCVVNAVYLAHLKREQADGRLELNAD